jgi:phosphoribosyl 1,2-cyclic phosphodiesterase
VILWGTRGSLPAAGPDTMRYGGNTSCVQVTGREGTVLVLDAGTGIRRLGAALPAGLLRFDVLLSHLHMDHIQGLGFFAPLYDPEVEVHVWGPPSTTMSLRSRLARYLSPPLFPVHLRDLPCHLVLHEVPAGTATIGEFEVASDLVCHPGPTVGFRIAAAEGVVTYLPDHEPALGAGRIPDHPDWVSGLALAAKADLLIHDAQYTLAEYDARVGWGHSAISHSLSFATLAEVAHLVPFHHDPAHDDDQLDRLFTDAFRAIPPSLRISPGVEGESFTR